MKKLIAFALLTVSFAAAAQTAVVHASWMASPTPGITNYVLYASQSSTFTNDLFTSQRWDAGTNRTASATIGVGTKWFFTVVAQQNGVSSPPATATSIIAYTPPASAGPVQLIMNFPAGTTVTSTATNITVTFP